MADKKKTEETPEETPVDEAAAEQAAPEAQAVEAEAPAAEETPAAEAEAPEAPVAEEAPAEEPAPEVPAEATEEAPVTDAEAAEAPAEEGTPQPAAVSEKKKKQKRPPRAERRRRSKPVRERPAERKPITRTSKPEAERGRRQERRGVVVSSAMDKTIVVKVDTIKAHPRYKKVVRHSSKFHAHDEQNSANVGDIVRIIETRPLSKSKHWKLVQIVEAAK
jgi:small subunit ribosomal protein S17